MGDIISRANTEVLYTINLFDKFKINITDAVISMWIVSAIIIIIAIIMSAKIKFIPSKKQGIGEMFIEFISNILESCIEGNVLKFVPFIGTMFIFLVVANIIDIVNIIIPSIELVPPMKDINLVLSLSIISILSIIYYGIKHRKVKGWLKSFIEPLPIMLPFNILDYLIKPVSLTLRMFGNIVAGFLIMLLIYSMVPQVLPAFASIYFDLFDGILQAYIFVFLTALYIGEAVEET